MRKDQKMITGALAIAVLAIAGYTVATSGDRADDVAGMEPAAGEEMAAEETTIIVDENGVVVEGETVPVIDPATGEVITPAPVTEGEEAAEETTDVEVTPSEETVAE